MAEKNILIIGGTYFAGRVFTFLAIDEGYHITLINRGRFSMKGAGDHIKEFRCDRRDEAALCALSLDRHYDAVIDFCAYEPGDISRIVRCLNCETDRYIYISTADVAIPSALQRDETSPLREQEPEDEVGQYVWKKRLLEDELKAEARTHLFQYTILRPAFIYGPYNYAPRESWYIKNILSGKVIPHPVDAGGRFNMVYVKDVARAILAAISSEQAQDQIFLLSAPGEWDYHTFIQWIAAAGDCKVDTYPVTVEQVLRERIPLPFPLTEAENELFDGQKIVNLLNFSYEDSVEAMKKTYQAVVNTYGGK